MFLNVYHLLYLFFISLMLTVTFTLVFRNKGPWNNPMLFFLVLFMTSWTVGIWTDPVTVHNGSYPILTVTFITVLISLVLTAAKPLRREKSSLRKLEDREVMDVVTKPEEYTYRLIPNLYFWILLILETLIIGAAYLFRHFEIIV